MDKKLICGPMATISHPAFRILIEKFGGCDEYFTEMINAGSEDGCDCGEDCHCDETCDCGCQEGKECTCGCGDKCECDDDCDCGCHNDKECHCHEGK